MNLKKHMRLLAILLSFSIVFTCVGNVHLHAQVVTDQDTVEDINLTQNAVTDSTPITIQNSQGNTMTLTQDEKNEAKQLAEKMLPYLLVLNGKPVLTTENLDTLGVTQDELNSFKQGLCLINSVGVNNTFNKIGPVVPTPPPGYATEGTSTLTNDSGIDTSDSSISQPDFRIYQNSSNVYITFSKFEVQIALCVGLVAAAVCGIVAACQPVGWVAISATAAAGTAIVGIAIGAITSCFWVFWNGGDVTITIPKSTLKYRRGYFYVRNRLRSYSLYYCS